MIPKKGVNNSTNYININFQFFRSTNAKKTFENLSKITRMSKLQMATKIFIELYVLLTNQGYYTSIF